MRKQTVGQCAESRSRRTATGHLYALCSPRARHARPGLLGGLIAGALLVFSTAWAQDPPPNLLLNPGFEDRTDTGALPKQWYCQPDKNEPAGAIALDDAEKHSGDYAVRIRHKQDTSYSRVIGRMRKTKPDTDYVASCWVKVDWNDKVVLARGPGASLGVKLFIGTAKGSTLAASRSVRQTAGKWKRVVVPFNSRKNASISLQLYLHRGRGTVWFDDAELIEGTKPTPAVAPTASGPARPQAAVFPIVDFDPGTVAYKEPFYLIQGEPIHLIPHYIGNPEQIGKLQLLLDVPEGIVLVKDYTAEGDPKAERIERAGKAYLRYVQDVLERLVAPKHNYYRKHYLILQANGVPPGETTLYWRLSTPRGRGPEHALRTVVLAPLPPLEAAPRKFHIIPYYAFPLVNAPSDRLLVRIHDLYAKAGLRGSVRRADHRKRILRLWPGPWRTGIVAGGAHFIPVIPTGEKEMFGYVAADGKKGGDARNERNLCPTRVLQANLSAKVAKQHLGFHGTKEDVAALDDDDWCVSDYEPSGKNWAYCFCPLCVKTFSEFAALPRADLTPETIQKTHREKWMEFRSRQHAQIIKQFADAVKAVNPKLNVGLCDNVNSGVWRRADTDPYVDFHCPMIYGCHPLAYVRALASALDHAAKPVLPTLDLWMGSHWYEMRTSPQELKIKILATAAWGGRGVMLWHGTHSMSGLDFVKTRECSDILAKLEDYFFDGKRADDAVVATARGNATFGVSRVHKLREQYLLSLFNFRSSDKCVMDVALPALAEGEYNIHDPIHGVRLGTPANGSELWRKVDLQKGFSMAVAPFDAVFLILSPGKTASAGPLIRAEPAAAARLARSTHVLEVPATAHPPVIDGSLGDPAWKHAARATNFMVTERPAAAQTLVHLLYDNNHLYFGIECQEPHMDGLVNKREGRDSSVWSDDCVEIFLRPGLPGTQYYHLAANARGALYDARGTPGTTSEDAAWTAAADVRGSLKPRSWIVELKIPLKDLGLVNPVKRCSMGLNICRERKRSGPAGKILENSSWFPAFGVFVPPKFGRMVLTADDSAAR